MSDFSSGNQSRDGGYSPQSAAPSRPQKTKDTASAQNNNGWYDQAFDLNADNVDTATAMAMADDGFGVNPDLLTDAKDQVLEASRNHIRSDADVSLREGKGVNITLDPLSSVKEISSGAPKLAARQGDILVGGNGVIKTKGSGRTNSISYDMGPRPKVEDKPLEGSIYTDEYLAQREKEALAQAQESLRAQQISEAESGDYRTVVHRNKNLTEADSRFMQELKEQQAAREASEVVGKQFGAPPEDDLNDFQSAFAAGANVPLAPTAASAGISAGAAAGTGATAADAAGTDGAAGAAGAVDAVSSLGAGDDGSDSAVSAAGVSNSPVDANGVPLPPLNLNLNVHGSTSAAIVGANDDAVAAKRASMAAHNAAVDQFRARYGADAEDPVGSAYDEFEVGGENASNIRQERMAAHNAAVEQYRKKYGHGTDDDAPLGTAYDEFEVGGEDASNIRQERMAEHNAAVDMYLASKGEGELGASEQALSVGGGMSTFARNKARMQSNGSYYVGKQQNKGEPLEGSIYSERYLAKQESEALAHAQRQLERQRQQEEDDTGEYRTHVSHEHNALSEEDARFIRSRKEQAAAAAAEGGQAFNKLAGNHALDVEGRASAYQAGAGVGSLNSNANYSHDERKQMRLAQQRNLQEHKQQMLKRQETERQQQLAQQQHLKQMRQRQLQEQQERLQQRNAVHNNATGVKGGNIGDSPDSELLQSQASTLAQMAKRATTTNNNARAAAPAPAVTSQASPSPLAKFAAADAAVIAKMPAEDQHLAQEYTTHGKNELRRMREADRIKQGRAKNNSEKSLEELAKEYPNLSPEHLIKLKRSSNRCHLVSRTTVFDANSNISMYELKFTAGKVFQVNALKSEHVYHVLFGYFIRRGISCFIGRNKKVLVMMPITYDFVEYLDRYAVNRVVLRICPEQPVTPSALHILTKLRRAGMSFAIDLMVLLKKDWNKAVLSIEFVMIDLSGKVREQLNVFQRLKIKAPWLKTIGYNDTNGDGYAYLAKRMIDFLDAPFWNVPLKFSQDPDIFLPMQHEVVTLVRELFKDQPNYEVFRQFLRAHENLTRDMAVFLYRFRQASPRQVQNISELYNFLIDYSPNRSFSVMIARAMMLEYVRFVSISSQYILQEHYSQAVIRGYFVEYMAKIFNDPFVTRFAFPAGMFSLLHLLLLKEEVDVIADDRYADIFDRIYGESELMADIIECVQAIEATDLNSIFKFILKYKVPPASVLISYEKALMRTNELLLVLNIVATRK